MRSVALLFILILFHHDSQLPDYSCLYWQMITLESTGSQCRLPLRLFRFVFPTGFYLKWDSSLFKQAGHMDKQASQKGTWTRSQACWKLPKLLFSGVACFSASASLRFQQLSSCPTELLVYFVNRSVLRLQALGQAALPPVLFTLEKGRMEAQLT